jgi:hypothetical protein
VVYFWFVSQSDVLVFMKKKQLGMRFIYLLELCFTCQAVIFVSPAKALDTNKDCGLYGVYNGKGRSVYDRTPVVIDLTSTIFDPPVTRDIQEQRFDILLCLKARGFLLLVLRSPLAMSDYSSIVEAIFSPVFRPLQARSLVPLGTVYTKFEVC